MEHPFRRAWFGGFHRLDVVNYIEKTARRHQNIQKKLELALSDLQERYDALEQQSAKQTEQLTTLTHECTRLQQALQEQKRLCVLAQTQEQQTAQQCTQLQEQLEQLSPDAQAYQMLKNRCIEIELQANCRAQAIVEDAQQQAQYIREQAEQCFSQLEADYRALHVRIAAASQQAHQQLEIAYEAFSQVEDLLSRQAISMTSLSSLPIGNPVE